MTNEATVVRELVSMDIAVPTIRSSRNVDRERGLGTLAALPSSAFVGEVL